MSTTKPAVQRSYGGISADDRRAERRGRLLEAGRQAWSEAGPTGVTVRGVCKRAGLIDRYFYEQFASRDELVLAVADDVRDELLSAMVTAGVNAAGTPIHKLEMALRAFLDTIARDPQLHTIATSDSTGIPGLAQRRQQILDMIADLVVRYAPDALAAGTPPQEVQRAALFITGGVNQLIEGWLNDKIALDTYALAAECARLSGRVLPSGNHHR
jgi:AcrR family transcriptional regulator